MLWALIRHHVGARMPERLMEWEHACFALVAGLVLAMPRVDLVNVRHEELWGGALMFLGSARIIGLIINGIRQRVTAWMRAIGAILTSLVFVFLALGYLWSGRVGVVAGFCIVLAAFEWINYRRSMRDVGRSS